MEGEGQDGVHFWRQLNIRVFGVYTKQKYLRKLRWMKSRDNFSIGSDVRARKNFPASTANIKSAFFQTFLVMRYSSVRCKCDDERELKLSCTHVQKRPQSLSLILQVLVVGPLR